MHLDLSLQQLIEIIGEGAVSAPVSYSIENLASLDNATSKDIAFVFDRGDASVFDAVDNNAIKKSQAGLIIAAQQLAPEKKFLIVNDPLAAFQNIVNYHLKKKQQIASTKNPIIDHSAQVAASAYIGNGTSIGKQSLIMEHVYVGRDCSIGNQVVLYPGAVIMDECIIGDGTIIHPGAVIGSDGFGYQVTKQGLRKIPHIGIVRIGRQVEIGANSTIDRAAFDETIVEDLVKIDNMVHLAHNVKVGSGTAIIAQTAIGGSTVIGKGCQIGSQVAIRDNISIGDGTKIVSKSGIMHSVKPGATLAGIPAVPFTQWKRNSVLILKLPELFKKAQALSDFLTKKRRSWWQRLFGK